MRSIRARRSPAAASGSTTNGSTGARRKRDFVFMPSIFCHIALGDERQLELMLRVPAVSLAAGGSSEGVPDASEDRAAAAIGRRIARPRGAAGERDADVVRDDRVQGEFAA